MTLRHFYFFLFIFIFLTGCGFHPSGNVPLAPPLHRLYLRSPDPYGPLAKNLREYLKFSCVQFCSCPEFADAQLVILSETESQQLLSVGGTQQTRQYNLTLTVILEITDPKGIILVQPVVLTETRTLPIQSNQILAGNNEANNLYHQMRRSIVFDIMNFLSSNRTTCLLMTRR